MAALAPSDVTKPSSPLSVGGAVGVRLTELATTAPEYRQIGTEGPGGPTSTGTRDEPRLRLVRTAEPAPSASPTKRQSIKGVVDDVVGDRARVSLFYAGRANRFLFDAQDFSDASAAYPGALFEIIVGSDLGYTIIHSIEEEAATRSAAPPPDLTFLDE